MVNYERGVYEPSDEVRVFDGSEEEEDVEGSRLPLLIVLALIVLFAFGGVVYFAYSQGVARGRGETPILTAAAGPDKVAPESPGGAKVPYQGFKIYEQPAPPDDPADDTTHTPAAAPQATPAVTAPAMTAPPAAKPQPAMAAAPSTDKPAPSKPAEKPVEKPVAMTAAPVAKPAPKPTVPTIATAAPRQLGAPASVSPAPASSMPTPAASVPAPAPSASAPAGAYVLQIGAYKSQAEADGAWKTYKGKHSALLAGYSENVQQADLGAKGTWYRLRVAGFADKDVASALCDRLKADGGACFLGK